MMYLKAHQTCVRLCSPDVEEANHNDVLTFFPSLYFFSELLSVLLKPVFQWFSVLTSVVHWLILKLIWE